MKKYREAVPAKKYVVLRMEANENFSSDFDELQQAYDFYRLLSTDDYEYVDLLYRIGDSYTTLLSKPATN